jgi:hypothetical protein
VPDGSRHQGGRRSATRRDRGSPHHDGPAPVAGKTLITHIEQSLDFLGWHIQRHRKPGTNRYYVYTYPAKKALRAVMAKVKTLCREVATNQPLDALLVRINPAVRGWCAYFRPGVSYATFSYLRNYMWHTVWRWVQRKHPRRAGGRSPAVTAAVDHGGPGRPGSCSTRSR